MNEIDIRKLMYVPKNSEECPDWVEMAMCDYDGAVLLKNENIDIENDNIQKQNK